MRLSWVPVALLVALVGASAISAAPAEPRAALPARVAVRRLEELLRAINTGERDSLVRLAAEAFAPSMLQPDDSILDFLHGQYAASGGFELRRILQDADRQVTALVQGRRKPETWLRYIVGVEPEPPHRVVGVFTQRASAAMAAPDSVALTPAELPARFASLVDRIAAEGRFSGSLCLVRDGKVLLNRAWGQADREAAIANTPDTRFGIASVGKMFTAVAIAQLVEAGRLRLDDRAAKYVPGWLPPGGDSITIEQLLTHTSGLGDYLDAVVNDRLGKRYDGLEDYRALAAASPPEHAPGSTFRYSNVGYLVLGAVLEERTGERWDEYVRERVLVPSGAVRALARRPRASGPALATGYHEFDEGRWGRTDSLRSGGGTPAGGGIATAEDLARFADALRAGRLVSPATLTRMTTPRAAMTGTGKQYGYGVTIVEGRDGRRVWGHEGGFPGVGALLETYAPEGYTLAVLSNTTGGAAPIGDAWRDLLLRTAATAR